MPRCAGELAYLVEHGLIVIGQGSALGLSASIRKFTAELNAQSLADLRRCSDELASSGLLPPVAGP